MRYLFLAALIVASPALGQTRQGTANVPGYGNFTVGPPTAPRLSPFGDNYLLTVPGSPRGFVVPPPDAEGDLSFTPTPPFLHRQFEGMPAPGEMSPRPLFDDDE